MGQVSLDRLVSRCEPLSRNCRGCDGSENRRTCVGDRGGDAGAGLLARAVGFVALIGSARAADLPVKAPPQLPSSAYDWTGFYLGGHFDYAAGSSRWSATSAGAPVTTGSVNFFNSFDAFNGSGSYAEGFQAGYNYMLPSRWLVGVEADVSFPNTVGGTATVASPIVSVASVAAPSRLNFPARCARGSDTRQISERGIGCSMRPADWRGAMTSSPARKLPAVSCQRVQWKILS